MTWSFGQAEGVGASLSMISHAAPVHLCPAVQVAHLALAAGGLGMH